MPSRDDLVSWVYQAVKENGGEASLLDVAKYIWRVHQSDLENSDNLFYTWQYDMRWAAQRLRDDGRFVSAMNQINKKWKISE